MTPQLIQLKSLPNVALVRMPELNGELELYYGSPTMDRSEPIYLVEHVHGVGKKFLVKIGVVKDGNWRIVSTLAEISEEQAAGMVDAEETEGAWPFADVFCMDYTSGSYTLSTALESFHSAIKTDGWYIGVNPIPEPNCDCLTEYDREGCDQECWKYINAQQRVLDPGHTLVIERK